MPPKGWATTAGAAFTLSWSFVPVANADSHVRSPTGDLAISFAVIALMGLVYIVPTIVAFVRRHPNRWPILGLNLILGGTGIVWFGCMIWSMMGVHRSSEDGGSHGGESGLNIFANDVKRVLVEPSFTPPPLPASADPVERLERLHRLFKEGAIDEEQYRQMRARLLSS